MRKKYKVSCILGLIGSSIALLLSLISLIYFAIYENFVLFLDMFLNMTSSSGTTVIEAITSLNIPMDTMAIFVYSLMVTFNVIALVFAIPGFIFSIVGFKNVNISAKDFQAKKKFNIWRIIGIGLVIESLAFESTEYIEETFSAISSLANVVCVIALIMGIVALVENGRAVRNIERAEKNAVIMEVYNEVEIEKTKENEEILNEVLNEIEEESSEQVVVNQAKLDEMYDLLSKLEKSYKTGEVSFEDYERMKKTILDNYMR